MRDREVDPEFVAQRRRAYQYLGLPAPTGAWCPLVEQEDIVLAVARMLQELEQRLGVHTQS